MTVGDAAPAPPLEELQTCRAELDGWLDRLQRTITEIRSEMDRYRATGGEA